MDFDLHDILTSQEGSEVATLLLTHWDDIRSGRLTADVVFMMMMRPSLPTAEQGEEITPVPQSYWTNCDLRIRSMQVVNFRSFPPIKDGEPSHGITLCPSDEVDFSNSEPCSLVLLGSNGSGKTSLYSAIEYYCCGRTAIAEKHNVRDEAKLRKFYSHLQNGENPEITIQFSGYPLDSGDEISSVDPKGHIDRHRSSALKATCRCLNVPGKIFWNISTGR